MSDFKTIKLHQEYKKLQSELDKANEIINMQGPRLVKLEQLAQTKQVAIVKLKEANQALETELALLRKSQIDIFNKQSEAIKIMRDGLDFYAALKTINQEMGYTAREALSKVEALLGGDV